MIGSQQQQQRQKSDRFHFTSSFWTDLDRRRLLLRWRVRLKKKILSLL